MESYITDIDNINSQIIKAEIIMSFSVIMEIWFSKEYPLKSIYRKNLIEKRCL